jgi:hypothetical protein
MGVYGALSPDRGLAFTAFPTTFAKSMKTPRSRIAGLMFALCVSCIPTHAGGVIDINIRKVGTNVVTSYGWDSHTNEASQLWFYAVASDATNAELNIIVTLGELTFPEAVEAIQKVVKPWRGPVFVNISSVAENGAVVTLTTRVPTGQDVSTHRSVPYQVTNGVPEIDVGGQSAPLPLFPSDEPGKGTDVRGDVAVPGPTIKARR